MAKFCTKCGASMADDAAFCTSCGAQQEAAAGNTQAAETPFDQLKGKLNKETFHQIKGSPKFNQYVGIAAIAVVAIIVLIILLNVLGGGYKKPIKNMVEGLEDADFDQFISAFPKEEQDQYEDAADYMYDGKGDKMMKAMLESFEDEYGDDIKLSYKITDKDKLDKDDLEDYEDEYKDKYDEKVKITKGYELEVELKIKGDDDDGEDEADMVVLKIDGDWYVYSGGMGM